MLSLLMYPLTFNSQTVNTVPFVHWQICRHSLMYDVGHSLMNDVGHSLVYNVGHSLMYDVGHSFMNYVWKYPF